jgi:large subunit ribosomal protein L15
VKINKLTKIKTRAKKRVGRGMASGKGKTAGRGMKGQKKREKVSLGFEGGQLPLYQRLPQKRGIGNIQSTKKISITTAQLNKLPSGTLVNVESLKGAGVIPTSTRDVKVKVVFDRKIEKKLKVNIPASKKAKIAIEKVGGKLIYENPT